MTTINGIFRRDFSIPPSSPQNSLEPSIASFPSDLVFKILCKLPPDVLLKDCRKVCRQWKRVVKIIPPQVLLPAEYSGIQNTEFSLDNFEFANDHLNFAKLKRYRAALLAEPERVYTARAEILRHLTAARPKPSASARQIYREKDGDDEYQDSIKDLIIRTQHVSSPQGHGCLYIELFRVTTKIEKLNRLKVTAPQSCKIKKIQYLLDRGLLLTRIDWIHKTSTASQVQVLLHQYTTGSCIFDNCNESFPVPKTLMKTITAFSLLETLAIRVVKQNNAFKYVMLVAVKSESKKPKQSLLQYNLG